MEHADLRTPHPDPAQTNGRGGRQLAQLVQKWASELYHRLPPVFMTAKCLKRAWQRSFLVESMALFAGYASGYVKRVPQVPDADAIRYLRQQQIRRLLGRPSIYACTQRPDVP